MKIIAVNNYGIESVADRLVAENVNRVEGEFIVEALNTSGIRSHSDWYSLVEDDKRLWRGMEELV